MKHGKARATSAKKIKISSSAHNLKGANRLACKPLSPPSPPEGYAGLLDFNLIFRRWLRFRSTDVATFRMKTFICRGRSRLSNANSCALSSRNIPEYRVAFCSFLDEFALVFPIENVDIFHVSLKLLNFYHVFISSQMDKK